MFSIRFCRFSMLVGLLLLAATPAPSAPAPLKETAGLPTWTQTHAGVRSRPREEKTFLVRNKKPTAVIAIPDESAYRAAAERLHTVITDKTGIKLQIVKDTDLVAGSAMAFTSDTLRSLDQGGLNLILLGNLSSNRVIARLYMDFVAFEDGAYPGKGGYTVRTLLDPRGCGWNVVVLGGSSPSEVEEASKQYITAFHDEADGLWSEYRLDVVYGQSTLADSLKGGTARMLARLKAWQAEYKSPESAEYRQAHPRQDPVEFALELLTNYMTMGGLFFGTSGDPELARGMGSVIDVLYEEMDWVEKNRKLNWDAHYNVAAWLRSWQQLAASGYLTRQQLERGNCIMAFLALQSVIYRWDLAAFGKTTFRNLGRHQYSGIFASDDLCRYIQSHCELEPSIAALLNDNRANFRTVIETMLQLHYGSYNHHWTFDSTWHYFQAAMEEPYPEFIESDRGRLAADTAVMCINNAGRWVNFGSSNVGPNDNYDAWQILGRAETLYRDGSYQWWLDNRMPGLCYKIFIMGLDWNAHGFQTNLSASMPDYFIGLNRSLVPQIMYEDMVQNRGEIVNATSMANDVAPQDGFLKISIRDGLNTDDQYLLLNGMGGVDYSGDDPGGILEYSRYGQRLLVDIENKPEPFFRNTISISQGNSGEKIDVFARLLAMADLGPVAYTRTKLDSAMGGEHVRSIFMEKHEYCLVFDDITVKKEGEANVTCSFHGPGAPVLDNIQRVWRLNNEIADLHLQNILLPGQKRISRFSTDERLTGLTPREWRTCFHLLHENVAGRFNAG